MIGKIDLQDGAVAQQIYELQQASYLVESQLIDYPNLPPLLETVEALQHTGEQFLIFKEDERILGALSYIRTGDILEICRLIVSPNHFRRGIAGKLLRAAEEVEVDIKRIIVSTAENNLPAVTLYQKNGYHLAHRTVLPDGLALVQLKKEIKQRQR